MHMPTSLVKPSLVSVSLVKRFGLINTYTCLIKRCVSSIYVFDNGIMLYYICTQNRKENMKRK